MVIYRLFFHIINFTQWGLHFMKDFLNDLIYDPNPAPITEPRFQMESVEDLPKSERFSLT